jgi:transposase-like protein
MSTNNRKVRRHFSADTKLQILKEGRHTNLSISQVCEQYQISDAVHQWERRSIARSKALTVKCVAKKYARRRTVTTEVQRLQRSSRTRRESATKRGAGDNVGRR